jgi:hypothetical protein
VPIPAKDLPDFRPLTGGPERLLVTSLVGWVPLEGRVGVVRGITAITGFLEAHLAERRAQTKRRRDHNDLDGAPKGRRIY